MILISAGTYTPQGGEEQSSETKTEQAGYLKPKAQIERMLQSGERLIAWRKEYYDFEAGKEDIPDDPEYIRVRDPNYDMADATQDMMQLERRARMARIERASSKKLQEQNIEVDKDLKVKEKQKEEEIVEPDENNGS